MTLPHLILEVANVHGGKKTEVLKIIKKFGNINYKNLGIKFQPFKYDLIALKSFSWFDVYKELFLNEEDWLEILQISKKNFKYIWLDLFDLYGVSILKKNISLIHGLKIQASVINNKEVYHALKRVNLKKKKIIINISGYKLEKINEILENYSELEPKEIVLQIGFQSYPTKISDSSLNKIKALKDMFPESRLCFADHLSADDIFSEKLPVIAIAKGCEIIEKHICLNRNKTKYDKFSALHYNQIKNIIEDLEKYSKAHSKSFINRAEKKYLNDSIQQPVLKVKKNSGSLISTKDLLFRRTSEKGITSKEIFKIQSNYNVLNKSLNNHRVIKKSFFRKSNIAVIVACRMKSTRLKEKAIIPINGISSIERCLQNSLKISKVSKVVLATSNIKEDKVLKNYTLSGKVDFFTGDPEDVILRYLDVCKKYNIDTVIRVTGDMPVVSPEIANYLLDSHFKTGAEYSFAKEYTDGSDAEIYDVNVFKKIIEYFGKAEYSEYMKFYMINNKNIFNTNEVELPEEYIRPYRLTLDYPEDLKMFNKLYKELEKKKLEPTIMNVYKILDNNIKIPAINNHLTMKYETDKKLIDLLNKKTTIKV